MSFSVPLLVSYFNYLCCLVVLRKRVWWLGEEEGAVSEEVEEKERCFWVCSVDCYLPWIGLIEYWHFILLWSTMSGCNYNDRQFINKGFLSSFF